MVIKAQNEAGTLIFDFWMCICHVISSLVIIQVFLQYLYDRVLTLYSATVFSDLDKCKAVAKCVSVPNKSE